MYTLRKYPDEILRKVAQPIKEFNKHLLDMAEEMFCIMYENNGVGLAAPQIGVGWQMFVINCSPTREMDEEMVFINPRILSIDSEQTDKEGCLSFPGIFKERKRPRFVEVEAYDVKGNKFTTTLAGLGARAVLHEYEHLQGILLIDDDYEKSALC